MTAFGNHSSTQTQINKQNVLCDKQFQQAIYTDTCLVATYVDYVTEIVGVRAGPDEKDTTKIR